MIRWVSAPGGQERDFILGLPGPGPWLPAAEASVYLGKGQDQKWLAPVPDDRSRF